ncbi:cyclin-like protein interacting with PHO85 [Ophidiomyces ophidiicola]|nr:cyclin-like protein interacting with PHO85 [Ophidiomyces ophidiicola]KAI1958285.1 cyclin-like protein interacting with PHO85 [Ophidiomyces ophidiicola]KAI2124493.1 cyclin-like protein interacting with PHO85 [Ophidiomyces ophidiicola]KAI2147444.1 cyclin-like protein interacting with PHO85 [Ophidiomyces ophidiicola]KAI2157206.1 cyclin-like protein interacting with PHO85 [Ophidiomyces ophidiicola]
MTSPSASLPATLRSTAAQPSHPSSSSSSSASAAAAATAAPPLPSHGSSRSLGAVEPVPPSRIRVRDLNHIRSFASEEMLAAPSSLPPLSPSSASASSSRLHHQHHHHHHRYHHSRRKYEISAMPVPDVIEMVAGLLSKITATNDRQHAHVHRHIPPPDAAATAALSPQAASVLAFHGKNVPSISILNYLTRIHKYCPTTYEVFLSLLIYFDRMTDAVNAAFRQDTRAAHASSSTIPLTAPHPDPMPVDSTADNDDDDDNDFDEDDEEEEDIIEEDEADERQRQNDPGEEQSVLDFSQHFVVDSYNIHRLVIAGVTCASKFFSDVFYTNSRYAKVGGLPLLELNHLELQFLLLNDFRLAIAVEELDFYASMLVEYYAREVLKQRAQDQHSAPTAPPPPSSSIPQAGARPGPAAAAAVGDGLYVRPSAVRQLSQRSM